MIAGWCDIVLIQRSPTKIFPQPLSPSGEQAVEVFTEPDSYRLQLVECQFFAEEALCPLPQEHGINAVEGDAEILIAAA